MNCLIKSGPGGRVDGYLIRYSSHKRTDLCGDYFSPSTEYGVTDGSELPIYYNHGLDPALGLKRLGRGRLSFRNRGIYIQGSIDLVDDFSKAVFELVGSGVLGWSSGCAAHLVDKVSHPSGAKRIVSWPLCEASLTFCPAEWMNSARAAKSVTEAARETLRLQNEGARLRHKFNARSLERLQS